MAKQPCAVTGKKLDLDTIDPDDTGGFVKDATTEALLASQLGKLYELQARFAADARHALLIVLQGLDASGKDGAIRHVFSGMNPQGCQVDSFKVPTDLEQSHDYLWRIHPHCPRKGMIEIFNRSHYEDILVPRVTKSVPKADLEKRYDHINDFERLLTDSDTVILKFYLHISRKEQRLRLQQRLDDPNKNWKFSSADLEVRRNWPLYRKAYNEVLARCNTPWAPWHVVPADKKWYRNLVIACTVVDALAGLDPQYPRPTEDLSQLVVH